MTLSASVDLDGKKHIASHIILHSLTPALLVFEMMLKHGATPAGCICN